MKDLPPACPLLLFRAHFKISSVDERVDIQFSPREASSDGLTPTIVHRFFARQPPNKGATPWTF